MLRRGAQLPTRVRTATFSRVAWIATLAMLTGARMDSSPTTNAHGERSRARRAVSGVVYTILEKWSAERSRRADDGDSHHTL